MSYKPTLFGLKALQQYLSATEFPMPVFKTDIYPEGKIESIDEQIRKHGPGKEITDCKIESKDGRYFIQFSDLKHVGLGTIRFLMMNGFGCSIEYTKDDELKQFVEENEERILNLTRWGKEKVNLKDRLARFLRLYPKTN